MRLLAAAEAEGAARARSLAARRGRRSPSTDAAGSLLTARAAPCAGRAAWPFVVRGHLRCSARSTRPAVPDRREPVQPGRHHRRGRDHGAADDADHHQRRDRPVGRLDPGHVQRAARLPVGRPLADAGDLRRARSCSGWPRACSTACWSPGSGCPRWRSPSARWRCTAASRSSFSARARSPTSRVPYTTIGVLGCRTPASPGRRDLHRAGRDLRRGAALHRRSAGRSTRWAPTRRPRSSPGSGSSGSRSCCSSSPAWSARWPGCCGPSGSPPPCRTTASALELNVVAIVLLAGVSIFGGKGSIIGVVLAVLAFAAAAERPAADELQPGGHRHRHRRAPAHQRLRAAPGVRRQPGRASASGPRPPRAVRVGAGH